MVDLNCPKCGNPYLTPSANKDRAFCSKCLRTFELTEVNAWYKDTMLEMKNIEYDKQN